MLNANVQIRGLVQLAGLADSPSALPSYRAWCVARTWSKDLLPRERLILWAAWAIGFEIV